MTIGEFSRICGLSVDTLRYYERLGLLRGIKRDRGGRREFRERDLSWIAFVKRLKDTDMPLTEILRYADLREQGDCTLQERKALLYVHANKLMKSINEQQSALEALQDKIQFYEQETKKNQSSA
ncbi:MAG TPA: MerR family transcriptional regulator [Polyangiaceae bacterium]